MPDFHSILNERMRIAWEALARRTNEKLRDSQRDLGERGLLGSGFELKEYAHVRAEAITERGEVVWQCISETLGGLEPPYSDNLARQLRRFAESYLPDNPTQEYEALSEQVTRLNYAPALQGMKYAVDAAMNAARRTLMLKLDEEMLRRKLAAVETAPDPVSNTANTWSDAKKWRMEIVSAVLVAGIIGLFGYLASSSSGIRDQDVPVSASSEKNFAIQSTFAGTAQIRGGELTVNVAQTSISYDPDPAGYAGPRRIIDLRVSLVEDHDGNSWKPVRQSEIKPLDHLLQAGEQFSLEPFALHLSVAGLPSLSGLWLVFDIDEETPGTASAGVSHAHARSGIFSD